MPALVDNDIGKKVAVLDLVSEFEALTYVGGSALVLPTAKYVFGANGKTIKKLKQQFGQAAANRICQFFSGAPAYPDHIEFLPELAGVDDIDAGEVGLFSAAYVLRSHGVVTGDKRAIEALATNPSCSRTRTSLQGRIMCLEQVVWAIILERGLPHVWARCKNGLGCDKALKMIFGFEDPPPLERVRSAFDSYIGALRRNANGLLHPLAP